MEYPNSRKVKVLHTTGTKLCLIIKRQVLLEAGAESRYSRAEFIGDDLVLPVFLKDSQESGLDMSYQFIHILPIAQPNNVDGFGRQAQATYLLDQAISAVQNRNEVNAKVSAMKFLDGEIRNLLAITMTEYRGPGPHCGANASALRQVWTSTRPIMFEY